MGEFWKKRWGILPGIVLVLVVFLLWPRRNADTPTQPFPSVQSSVSPAPIQDEDADKIRISELMLRNKATLPDEDGDFPDWIELENVSEETVPLAGWRLSDRENRPGWPLPDRLLAPGERLLVFADGKERDGHTGFSLSAGETLSLYTAKGALADRLLCPDGAADSAWLPDGEGGCRESRYPSPGYSNDAQGYCAFMQTQTRESPLLINEVVTFSRTAWRKGIMGDWDWVEFKNVSDRPVLLSSYYLSDKEDDRLLVQLPAKELAPGELFLLPCDAEGNAGDTSLCTAFSLDSAVDRLYLTREDGLLADYVSLREIPNEGSFGRMDGENGWFFFAVSTPGGENRDGKRRIAETPRAAEPDGVFNDVDGVTVELLGEGEIRYTTDGSLPTEESDLYVGPIRVEETGVVRAVSLEEDALPSRPLTLSYILNENHSLPVLSLVSDNSMFAWMYHGGKKGLEVPGSLSFYEDGGSFTIPCGIKMHGETSLVLAKKNMSVRFRGAYGQDVLHYDLFDGGVTEFQNLLLRAGQDYYHAIIRNELCTELALAASDRVVTSRSRFCVLYVDGKYNGIYALEEKLNEAMYAHLAGVSRRSVTVETAPLYNTNDMYQEVIAFAEGHDLSDPQNYREICSRLDVDSLIDWIILEGVFANDDLTFGNVRYCRSAENDGKWRLMFYDLDSTFYSTENCFANLLSPYARGRQVGHLIGLMLQSGDFRDRLLRRACELLRGPLSNESILAEIDRLAAEIDPEVARDYEHFGMHKSGWEWNIDWLKEFITDKDWAQVCIDKLCFYLRLSDMERAKYFGT